MTEHGEKPSLSVKVGAGDGSALVTGKIEGGLISGVPPFGDAAEYQTPDLWVSGFGWFWAMSACPALAADAGSVGPSRSVRYFCGCAARVQAVLKVRRWC